MNKILATVCLFLFLTVVTSCVKSGQTSDSVESVVRYELKCRMAGPDGGSQYLIDWNTSREYYITPSGSVWVSNERAYWSYTPRHGEACRAYETSHPIR